MEKKEGKCMSGRLSNRMGPDRIARSLSELYMMTNATANGKGSRNVNYDSYDACLRSFTNWLRYMRPTLTMLASADFFYVGVTYSKCNMYSLRKYNVTPSPHTRI